MTEQEATRFEPLTMTMLQSAMGLTANPLPLLASATSSFAFSQVPTEVLAFFSQLVLSSFPTRMLMLLFFSVPHWTKALLLTDLQETLAVADLESLVKLLRRCVPLPVQLLQSLTPLAASDEIRQSWELGRSSRSQR